MGYLGYETTRGGYEMSLYSDKLFIKRLAIEQYHKQYNIKLLESSLDVRNIAAGITHDVAYEVFTVVTEDNISLKLYFAIDRAVTSIKNFKLLNYDINNPNVIVNNSLVTTGILDKHFIDNGTFSLTKMNPDLSRNNLLLLESTGYVLLESGGNIVIQ